MRDRSVTLEAQKMLSPNGAADHSQGIHPLVRSAITSSPNGATETLKGVLPTCELVLHSF